MNDEKFNEEISTDLMTSTEFYSIQVKLSEFLTLNTITLRIS